MPDTPNFAITYPCMDTGITCDSFRDFAMDVEAALVTVDAEAAATLNLPYARSFTATANPAFGVEAILTSGTSPTGDFANGVTFVPAAGTMTIITPGIYQAAVRFGSPQSTLTITSQRVAVYVNGVFQLARKYRGTNPASNSILSGSYTANIGPLVAGDVVTFRYLWTGTGALTAAAPVSIVLSFLTTP